MEGHLKSVLEIQVELEFIQVDSYETDGILGHVMALSSKLEKSLTVRTVSYYSKRQNK